METLCSKYQFANLGTSTDWSQNWRLAIVSGMVTGDALIFRAEKRSAQASAHPLSQAKGGLFCLMTGSWTGRVDCVCL